jgi:hypothetical protein
MPTNISSFVLAVPSLLVSYGRAVAAGRETALLYPARVANETFIRHINRE